LKGTTTINFFFIMATDEIDDVDGDLDLDNGLKKSASLLDFKHTGREIEEDRHHYFNTDPSPRSLKKALSFSSRRGLTSGSGDDSGDGSDLMEKDIIFKKPIHKRSILRKNSLPTVSSPDTVELNSQRASLNLSQKEREREIPSGNLSDLVGQVLVKIISAKDLPKKGTVTHTFHSSILCLVPLLTPSFDSFSRLAYFFFSFLLCFSEWV
jgi:hypothetical protein